MERGDECKGDGKRSRVPDLIRESDTLRDRQDQHGNRRLTHPAEAK